MLQALINGQDEQLAVSRAIPVQQPVQPRLLSRRQIQIFQRDRTPHDKFRLLIRPPAKFIFRVIDG
jgi:hypothetical protein